MRHHVFPLLVLAIISTVLIACGQPDGDSPDPGLVSLRLEPATALLSIRDNMPTSQVFRVIAIDENSDELDVTADAALVIETPSLGTFAGPVLTTTADRVGSTDIVARYRNMETRGQATVLIMHEILDPLMPANVPERFETALPGGAPPSLAYPASNVIVPPNLGRIEFHFLPGGANDMFAIDFIGEFIHIRFYAYCTNVFAGCYFAPDEDGWALLVDAGRGKAPLYYSVTGIDSTLATPYAATSGSRSIGFSFYDIEGGLYYWAASTGAVMRYDFGREGQTPERFLDTQQTDATQCVGCHALSRDGSTIAVGLDIPGPAAVETYTVATKERMWTAGGMLGGGANFFTYAPDNNQVILSNGIGMTLHNAHTGAVLAEITSSGTMPDWSSDAERVVFARPSSTVPCPVPGFCSAVSVNEASLMVTDTTTWSTTKTLVPADGGNNYYPSFSPDNQWIIYNRNHQGSSYDAPDAQIWTVHASGGAPVQLIQASPAPGGDSWPKWSPFVDEYREGQLMWLTFSSRRDHGLRTNMPAQLWMVGFDPARAAAGQDPSFTAFWLPFQNPLSSNHIAQWVENIDRMSCDIPEDCPQGELCEQGTCLPDIQ